MMRRDDNHVERDEFAAFKGITYGVFIGLTLWVVGFGAWYYF